VQAYADAINFDQVESRQDWVLLAGTKRP
jgi:hypothetical protein